MPASDAAALPFVVSAESNLAANLQTALIEAQPGGTVRLPCAEAQAVNLVIDESPEIGFVNLGIGAYPIDPAAVSPSVERPQGTPVPEPAAVALPQDAE